MVSVRFLLHSILGAWSVGVASAAVVLPATEDNNTNKSTATTVVANGLTLALKEAVSSQGNARTAFFKFNTATASPVTDGTTAHFSFTLAAAAGTNFNMAVYALNTVDTSLYPPGASPADWTETTITWNNSPAFSSSATNNYIDLTQATRVGNTFQIANNSAAGTTYEVSFQDWQTFLTGSNLTLILVVTSQSTGSPTLSIASSDNTTYATPSLQIIPEPSALLMAAISSLGLLRRRR